MTPTEIASAIAASAIATLVQVEIYAPRKRWWHRRVRLSAADLGRAIGNNAAAVVAVAMLADVE